MACNVDVDKMTQSFFAETALIKDKKRPNAKTDGIPLDELITGEIQSFDIVPSLANDTF